MALDPSNSTFLCLPREVRENIYIYYLELLQDPNSETSNYYLAESHYAERAFLIKPYVTGLPLIMTACWVAFKELAPDVLYSASIRFFRSGFSHRIGVGVFGRFDLARVRRLTLIVDNLWAVWMDGLPFFKNITSFTTRPSWFKSLFEDYSEGRVPAATKLEDLVVVWGPNRETLAKPKEGPEAEEEEATETPMKKRFLRHIAGLSHLKTIWLRPLAY